MVGNIERKGRAAVVIQALWRGALTRCAAVWTPRHTFAAIARDIAAEVHNDGEGPHGGAYLLQGGSRAVFPGRTLCRPRFEAPVSVYGHLDQAELDLRATADLEEELRAAQEALRARVEVRGVCVCACV